MAKKFTVKELANILEELFVDLSPEEMVVKTGKGKKAVVDEVATWDNIKGNLLYYRGLLDGVDALADVLPDGADEIVVARKEEFDTLYAYAEENYADELAELVEALNVESFGILDEVAEDEDNEDSEEEIDVEEILGETDLADLKKIAKALGLKVLKKDDEDSLIEKILDADADDIADTLVELGIVEDIEDETDDDAEEEEDDESGDEEEVDYSEMSLSELRAECKDRGIKYTPKQKADALIELLEADDEANAGEEEEEDEDEEVESVDYSDMSLGELRKECKARGIKYTPKQKADDLIALLEESDAEEEEDDESGDEEEVSENELDEILDTEFEDETLEAEESKTSKKGGKLPPKKKGRK